MQKARFCWVVAFTAMCGCGPTLASMRVQPEELATLHVGEIAVVHMPSQQHHIIGSGGSAMVLMKQKQQHGTTIYFYRANEIGNQTILAIPKGLELGHCISCVTVHYFIRVVQ
jgi:hypothetical protein